MPSIDTAILVPGAAKRGEIAPQDNKQIYCGLDSCITLEVFEAIQKTHKQTAFGTYNFEKAMQAPYLEIMQRGFRIDVISRKAAVMELTTKKNKLQEILDEFADAVWDAPLNPRSPKQLQEFFYKAMLIPEIMISQKGVKKMAMNREVLEKLEKYLYARPFVNLILAIRDCAKQIEVFEKEIDHDNRFRASYNIAGTETGRPSSSSNAFGTGGNAQNIAPGLRFVFVADPGWKLCVIDLEQVEARDVGFFAGCLFNDWKFLDNCESGDLHTNNAKLVWTNKPWTGDKKADREIADQIFYREFSHRDMAKRGGHLSNYYGTPFTMARSLKIPQAVAEEFQARYVRGGTFKDVDGMQHTVEPAFPGIARWWQWTAHRLQTVHNITTPFGRTRHFFGRPDDDTTLREAIAFLPQSTTADRMNLALYRIWRYMPHIQLLAQTYDSVSFQYREDDPRGEDAIVSEALKHVEVELTAQNGRKYIVPGEAKVGWNWGYYTGREDVDRARKTGKIVPRLNLDGLMKWSPKKKDERKRQTTLERFGSMQIK